MNFSLFLGRFHPLIVHLPIGFLVLAMMMQVMIWLSPKYSQRLDQAIEFSLLAGGAASLLSVFLGLLLASDGSYAGRTLFWHQWMGIGVLAVSVLAWLIKTKKIRTSPRLFSMVLFLLLVALAITGHLGGNLTHGSDYLLTYGPAWLQASDSSSVRISNQLMPTQPDSIEVYTHLIEPILQRKCYSCHNEEKAKGKLVLTSIGGILAGGQEGASIQPKKPYESPLFQRVSLPQGNKKFMPPKGEPLSYVEIALLKWWIEMGAPAEASLSSLEKITAETEQLLQMAYGIDLRPKPLYERLSVAEVSTDELDLLQQAGYKVNPLGEDNHFLEVKYEGAGLTQATLRVLLTAQDQITRLDLGESDITDEGLAIVGKLANLTFLKLDGTGVTDEGMQNLLSLSHLVSLNLVDTQITTAGLATVRQLPELERVFTYGTGVGEIKSGEQVL